jgi:hypothetical protein
MARMTEKIAVAAGLAAVVVAGGAGIGVHRHRSRVKTYCALPPYDYQHLKYAPSVQTVSHTFLLVPLAGPTRVDPTGKRLKYFQLDTATVALDHCEISQFSLVLREDGNWSISLRASQNPPKPPQIPPPTTKQTLQIKRNEFVIRVHGFADTPLKPDEILTVPGRPILFDLYPDPFWVQNGQPREFRDNGTIPDFAPDFDAIDRVELEFTYR